MIKLGKGSTFKPEKKKNQISFAPLFPQIPNLCLDPNPENPYSQKNTTNQTKTIPQSRTPKSKLKHINPNLNQNQTQKSQKGYKHKSDYRWVVGRSWVGRRQVAGGRSWVAGEHDCVAAGTQ